MKTVEQTQPVELSTLTVEEILPNNFDKLSARKQKEIIFNTVMDTYKLLANTLTFKHKGEAAKKKLQWELKSSETAQKLTQLKKQLKETSYQEVALMERYNGMKKLAAALGFDEKRLEKLLSQNVESED